MADLSYRARRILYAVVTEFIASGDPVGSRTLAKKFGLDLSSASIRNVMADLEEAGYLAQPHTSAGRIPTDKAFRLFIDALMDVRTVLPEERAQMDARFAEIYAAGEDTRRETGKLLSELAGTAAVVGSPRGELRTLSQLRFLPTRPGQLLAVIVLSDGTVENRFLASGPLEPDELTRVHNLLADVIEGRTLGEVRDLFARRLNEERVHLDALRRRAFDLGSKAIGDLARRSEVVIEGQSKLLHLPEYADVERLRQVMHALEEREQLVELLDRTIAAGGVTVFVGHEAGELGGGSLSLVVAPYTEGGRVAGTVGVLGPTRMDYARVMPLVDATADALSSALGKKPSKPGAG